MNPSAAVSLHCYEVFLLMLGTVKALLKENSGSFFIAETLASHFSFTNTSPVSISENDREILQSLLSQWKLFFDLVGF